MSDLIKRSDVLGLLYKIFDEYNMSTDKTSKLRTFGSDVFKAVRGIPTAYDIDNVVEELETKKQNALEVEESIKEYNVWNEAIEIVKQGGVSDDVCGKR